ncbi:MAG: polysaccharide lyase family 7 protein [Paucimonas sp.]|jgi:hypothetical protein|nr:polysaccharide lyase family 7 protein [Paucimonas sp.]
MAVNIDKLTITTPVARSSSIPIALELTGTQALATLPGIVSRLADGSIRFNAPTRGASSKSTQRTRCEWKEPLYWALGSASRHRNHQRMTLEKVNAAQKVAIAQMHVRDDDSPVIKVFWNKGKISFGFRQDFNQAIPLNADLLTEVPPGTPFDITIEVNSNGVASVSATCNGRSASSPSLLMAATWNDHTFDFHGGIYNQLDYDETTPTDDGSVCVISQLDLSHQ